MGSNKTVPPTAPSAVAARVPLAAALQRQENGFRIWLAFAAVLHAALIFGVTRASPRQMGERSGRPDGISVVLVDEADLASRNTFREDGASAAPATTAPSPAPAAPAPPQPDAAAPPVRKQQPASQPDAATTPPSQQRDHRESAISKETLEALLSRPAESAGSGAANKQPKHQQKPPLQLTMPNIPVAPGGRAAAVMRPPGATRSGENDDFWRGVIRALRVTMPSPRGLLGRVTVRLLLSDNGNLVEVKLVTSAGMPALDQSVVFAVKQASFPIPPARSPVVDRTFLVTYVYN